MGGIVGWVSDSDIRNSHNNANITLKGISHAGGIAGEAIDSGFFNVYNTGDINGIGYVSGSPKSYYSEGIGGIVGRFDNGQMDYSVPYDCKNTILGAYNAGNVTGGYYVGGILGHYPLYSLKLYGCFYW